MSDIALRVTRSSRNLWRTRAQRLWTTVGILIAVIAFLVSMLVIQKIDITQLESQYKQVEAERDALKRELVELAEKVEEPIVVNAEPQDDSIVNAEPLGKFKITYYCPCKGCSEGWDTQTSTGAIAQEGITIAVDPKVIPYGTLLYIEGIGYRIAQDCGGAIQGQEIDVYMNRHSDIPEEGTHDADVYLINTREV